MMSANKLLFRNFWNGIRRGASANLDGIVQYPSPNWNSRNRQRVVFLIEHYTAEDKESALRRLTDPAAQVSAHYLVDEEGTIYQLVDERNRAWHAGFGSWDGYTDINSVSIGIEIVNPGNAPYTQAQTDSVTALSSEIVQRYGIPAHQVLGHSDVAVTVQNHKSDPGWFFDWRGLAAHGVGVFPQPVQDDYDNSAVWSDTDLKQNLTNYGYCADTDLPMLVEAFQRHFQQEVAQTPASIGVADAETRARLACLLRLKPQRKGRIMPISISRFKRSVKKLMTRTGVEITIPEQPMTERERLLAMSLGFAYSVLGFGFGIYCLFKGVELFQSGITDGHGSWNGGGVEFKDLAPGTLLFIIGGYCFKTSAFIVKSGDSATADQKASTEAS